jgi:hypothetical protein
MIRTLSIAALACVALGACASRPKENVGAFWYVNSAPAGAVVTTSEGHTCVTPCRLDIPRWRKKERQTFA